MYDVAAQSVDTPEIELNINNCASNDPCAFCGKRTDPYIPLAYFKKGTYATVCPDCIEKYGTAAQDRLYRLVYKLLQVDGAWEHFSRGI